MRGRATLVSIWEKGVPIGGTASVSSQRLEPPGLLEDSKDGREASGGDAM